MAAAPPRIWRRVRNSTDMPKEAIEVTSRMRVRYCPHPEGQRGYSDQTRREYLKTNPELERYTLKRIKGFKVSISI